MSAKDLRKPTLAHAHRHRPQRAGLLACAILLTLATLLGYSCKRDDTDGSHRYPDYVAKIMRRNCSIKGCHTAESAVAAGGLNLETWDDLFLGSRGGSPVIPYAPDQSYLLYAINTDSSIGPVLTPTMPIGRDALSAQEYSDLKQWILEGARNDRGKEKFPPAADRRKWYVGNQGCDFVSVFDAESKQIMRYIEVGNRPTFAEYPHKILVSPDQQSWYVVFDGFSSHIEQWSTLTDTKVADISLGHNGWNDMTTSPDGKFGFVAAEYIREVATVNLAQASQVGPIISISQNISGPAVHPTRQTLYLAGDDASNLVLLDYDNAGTLSNKRNVDLVQNVPPVIAGELLPYKIFFLPDGSKYFVICWHSLEVRVMDGATDSLLAVIPVGSYPSNFAYSPATGHLFVACMEDVSTLGGDATKRGTIAVIDVQTQQAVTRVYAGYQPFGIVVDEVSGYLVVANRNLSPSGPTSHHAGTCVGRNGYVTLIDLQTLQLVEGFKAECTVDPYTAALKR